MTSRRSPRSLLSVLLLAFLAALCVVTFLFAPVSVTLDGYSHLYNASVLRWMLSGQPAAHSAFTYNSWLIPNWAAAFILAALSAVLPASIALRILILLVAAVFLFGLYFCIDTKGSGIGGGAGERAQALIVLLPFALSAFLTVGFYDFLLSTAICFVILGLELRHGARISFRVQVTIAILLMIAWLAHPLPLALSFLFPAAMIAGEAIECRERGWRPRLRILRAHLRHLWPWALPLGLMAWFYLGLRTVTPTIHEMPAKARLMARIRLLDGAELAAISPSGNSRVLFVVLMVVFLATILVAIGKPAMRSRRVAALLLLGIFTLLLFLVVPDGLGEASAIPARVLLFSVLFLVLLAFSEGVVNPLTRVAAMTISTLIVIGFAQEYWLASGRMAPAAREIDAAMATLPSHARILIAGYRMAPDCGGPGLLERSVPERHWAIAGAIGKQLIVLNDYEGYTSVFPLKYINSDARGVDEVRIGPRDNTALWASVLNGNSFADYIVAWGSSRGAGFACDVTEPPPFEAALKKRYDLILAKDGASHVEIWKSRQ